jgi:hypothetical protein
LLASRDLDHVLAAVGGHLHGPSREELVALGHRPPPLHVTLDRVDFGKPARRMPGVRDRCRTGSQEPQKAGASRAY